MDINEMIKKLIDQQGAIVSTTSLDESSIETARNENRMFVDENGFGLVYLDHYHVRYSYDHGKGKPSYSRGDGDL